MANITAADVNKLRTITGAGMMDCKKALVEADGDFDKAIEILRKKGQKVAANRSDRESTEGAAIAAINADKTEGAVITLNCETDFVGKNEGFVKLATELANLALNFDNKEAFLASDFSRSCWSSATVISLLILGLFLIFLADTPNLKVEMDSEILNECGEHVTINAVLLFPPKDSWSILVSLESL